VSIGDPIGFEVWGNMRGWVIPSRVLRTEQSDCMTVLRALEAANGAWGTTSIFAGYRGARRGNMRKVTYNVTMQNQEGTVGFTLAILDDQYLWPRP